jgi:hypothetical protein
MTIIDEEVKKFDETFCVENADGDLTEVHLTRTWLELKETDPETIKSFLTTAIKNVLRGVKEKVGELEKPLPRSINLEIDAIGAAEALREQGYNTALSHVEELLEKIIRK